LDSNHSLFLGAWIMPCFAIMYPIQHEKLRIYNSLALLEENQAIQT
jgi:hypothetical protein